MTDPLSPPSVIPELIDDLKQLVDDAEADRIHASGDEWSSWAADVGRRALAALACLEAAPPTKEHEKDDHARVVRQPFAEHGDLPRQSPVVSEQGLPETETLLERYGTREWRDALAAHYSAIELAQLLHDVRREIAYQCVNFGLRARGSDVLGFDEQEPKDRLELMEAGASAVFAGVEGVLNNALKSCAPPVRDVD